jgi:WD40 repeat protein
VLAAGRIANERAAADMTGTGVSVPPPSHDPAGAGGWPFDLAGATAMVLDQSGQVCGAAFLVADSLLVTCAHVAVRAGGAPPTGAVQVRWPRLDDEVRRAWVDAALWRPPEGTDVAFLRLFDPPPAGAQALRLGPAGGVRSHRVRSFGYALNAPGSGHFAYATAGDLVRGAGGDALLQLTDSTEVTEGFSGAPVLDDASGLVLGMVDSVAAPDRLGRGRSTAYATPTEVLREVCPQLSPAADCPYLNLRPFTTDDAGRFHGRDRAVDAVLAALRRNPRFVALLGPSGSGKSSLVHAGVLPALGRAGLPGSDRWGRLSARPGADPPAQLAAAGLAGLGVGGAGQDLAAAARRWLAAHTDRDRLVLVLDQFEELLVATPAEARSSFLWQLVDLAAAEPAVTVLVILRDDFYSSLAAAAPMLMPLVESGLVNVPAALEPGEVVAIIARPAADAGLSLEPNLTERIAADAAGIVPTPTGAGAGTTVLPLLSSALTELWERREDARLTHDAYARMGGILGWLSRWCDRGYANACRRLTVPQQALSRHVLTALVRPGDEAAYAPATRQRRTLGQLGTSEPAGDTAAPGPLAGGTGRDGGMADVVAVVTALADQRLVTTSRDPASGLATVELTHEALIGEWDQLRRWLSEDHEFLSWRQDAETSLDRWRASGTGAAAKSATPDSELLLKGTQLEAARGWLSRRPGQLRADLVDYIRASDRAEVRRQTRDRRRVVVLAGLLVVALVFGVVAGLQTIRSQRDAERARTQAQLAVAGGLAAQAVGLARSQPDLATLLSLQSLATAPSQAGWVSVETSLSHRVALSEVLYGPQSAVQAVAFSPDGRLLAGADFRGLLHLWDVHSGQPAGSPFPADRPALLPPSFYDVAFSRDGRRLATIGNDGVQLWDVETRRPVAKLAAGLRSFLGYVTFSPDGRLLGVAYGDTVRLWDATSLRPSGQPIETRSGSLTALEFSPDSRTLVTASDLSLIRRYDVRTHRRLENIGASDASADRVRFTPDGTRLVIGDQRGGVRIWSLAEGRLVTPAVAAGETPLQALAVHPDGRVLATADSQGVVRLLDLSTGRARGVPLVGQVGRVTSLAFSPDGRGLASGGADGTVRLWDLAERQPLGEPLTGHAGPVEAVAFSPDGRQLATGGFDTTLRRWDVRAQRQLSSAVRSGRALPPTAVLSPDPVARVAYSGDGRFIVTGGARLALWDAGTGRWLADLPASGRTSALAVSPDGARVAGVRTLPNGGPAGIQLWSLPSRTRSGGLLEGSEGAGDIAFSPDGRLIAGALGDRVRLWDVANGDRVADLNLDTRSFERLTVLAFSPDGRLLATADGIAPGHLRIWDVARRRPVGDPMTTPDGIQLMAFGGDGVVLATASGQDNTIRLWDLANRTEFADPLALHTDRVDGLAFSPDGSLLASASRDGTARLWASPTGWIAEACRIAGRNLTRAEWDRYVGADVPYTRNCPDYPNGFGVAAPAAPAASYPAAP